MIYEHHIAHHGIKIHYTTTINPSSKSFKDALPLIIVPGFTEDASDYSELMRRLLPKTSIAISLRGRGASDAPVIGYTLADHMSDIEAVVQDLGIGAFILFGFSRGASYALGYALKHSEQIAGLILGDYPARHTRLPESFVDYFTALPPWRGKTALQRMPLHAITQIQKESVEVSFLDDLSQTKWPLLIFKGEGRSAILTEEGVSDYLTARSNAQILRVTDTGHDIFTSAVIDIPAAISDFIATSSIRNDLL